ncbi:peptidoglycan D,D-transpeptidase FtsI family protein [Lentilactobacillus otakiensis]|uniref:Penicillin-binding protein transpeptidase n=1 Tax=Lentilactobacillus otakiensis DSM 19908 = JCM 15040 TaxID=1423780 RepID=S4PN62_9LACO|nr:penicillin-binding protein 2 [Lentilactobacillus otakiensis]KRL09279.1 penicillin-binding protein transpeptidase [Lentilactobacillus otakiensis DSM 19908 = JCM 15040]MBZ3776665.1 penicillin-binding protein 2 [Lentilactobacillus otakiensis]MDV3519115.1 penicillin-binding protein 2 [Lentilactobacillus otakiensis]GAD15715.1 penicillin-binding protein transpeptidase [Lentilactobacillus otakiensis DSM 19908 = JCM 15040]
MKIFKKRTKKTNKGKAASLPFRINIIFIVVGILFVALLTQLAYLQVMYGSKFKAEVNRSDTSVVNGNVQRGMIFDSTGHVLVGNSAHQAIIYTKGVNVLSSDMYKTANRLAQYVTVPTGSLTKRQLADYYLADASNLAKVEKTISGIQDYSADAKYDKAVTKVEGYPNSTFSAATKNAATIFAKMSGAYQLSTVNIKDDKVSTREVAMVGEHLADMPGVNVGTSWSRNYPNGQSIQGITGTVSNEKSGLPSDRVNELLAQGYSRNDSVGQSYLERQYEPVLRGTKSQTQIVLNSDNQIKKEIKKYGGQKGDNLQLTINAKFQKQLQSLVHSAESSAGGNSTGTYAVVMNPNNGAIIGMAGVDRNPKTSKITDNILGTINSSIVMGSVVKGAMVSGALMDHVITPTNSTLTDQPITTGGVKKSSWFNHNGHANISVDASDALQVSSNSYMMQLAMKEGHFNYVEGGALTMSPNVFNTMRGYFNQFGLGVKTGVDIPGESTGLQGASGYNHIGSALDLSFGNYDAYTTMQVAQYMSTIANGGNRIEPHVVEAIRGTSKNGKLGTVKATVMPKVLNHIDMTKAQRDVVKTGLYRVVHGTNTYKTGGMLSSIKPEISAKTGTAQTFYNGNETVTLSLASYAPSSHPQVVVALAMPNLGVNAESNNMALAKQIYSAYWKTVQSTSTVK